jgi:lysophospholipase L1-like esterase
MAVPFEGGGRQLLVYGDSLTWGIIPDTRNRLPFEGRWPGVMEHRLAARGRRVRIMAGRRVSRDWR